MTYQLNCECTAGDQPKHQASFVARIVGKLKQQIADSLERYRLYRKVRTDRAAFNQMLSLDDEILDDIGVTRENVRWASQLPIHQSAAQALNATQKRIRPKIRP